MTSHNDKTHPTTGPADSPNKRQAAALLTAAVLAAVDGLPAIASWNTTFEHSVEAQLWCGDEADTLAELYEWARFFGGTSDPVAIQSRPYATAPESTRVWVETSLQGVHVEIWSMIATLAPAPAELTSGAVTGGVAAAGVSA